MMILSLTLNIDDILDDVNYDEDDDDHGDDDDNDEAQEGDEQRLQGGGNGDGDFGAALTFYGHPHP